MLKYIMFIAVLTACCLAPLAWTKEVNTEHQKLVETKLEELCADMPEWDCSELKNYCRKALEAGGECYVF